MPETLLVASAVSYALNVALGTAVAARIVDTSGFRWLHHALYTSTCVLSGCALAALLAAPGRRSLRVAALLAPAAGPLAVVPFVDARSPRHPLVALGAAPFFAAAVIGSRRERRKA